MESIHTRVQSTIAKILPIDESRVIPEARFRTDLKVDSLDIVELVMAFEDEFELMISDADANHITTVGEAIVYIYEHTKDQSKS